MPWKESSLMDERLQFVARRLAGEAMGELREGFATGADLALAMPANSPSRPGTTSP